MMPANDASDLRMPVRLYDRWEPLAANLGTNAPRIPHTTVS
jgi:hypothetical protein